MRPYTLIAIILIAIGTVSFAYRAFSYKSREKVLDIGSVEVTAEKTKKIRCLQLWGAVALVGA